jgi:hypothetical protein
MSGCKKLPMIARPTPGLSAVWSGASGYRPMRHGKPPRPPPTRWKRRRLSKSSTTTSRSDGSDNDRTPRHALRAIKRAAPGVIIGAVLGVSLVLWGRERVGASPMHPTALIAEPGHRGQE